MNRQAIVDVSRQYAAGYLTAWDRFWFTPRMPHTLGALRLVTGAMLLYSHLVLASDLSSFLGDHAWINNEVARQLHDGAYGFSDFGRSYLWHIGSPLLLWLHHFLTLLVTAAFLAGFLTRLSAPLAWFLQLMYLHRLTGTLFGLDQIVTYSTMYLMLAPCGACFSVDAWLRRRNADRVASNSRLRWLLPDAGPSVAANIATRLFQLHLCVIYLFGGLAKARGTTWWDGTAMWYSVGSYEYQSIDLTWIANYPRIFTAMTHATLFWEVFYCALIWPRRTRPIMLVGAAIVHGGIALFLGMITFGVMMIAANMIFLEPRTVYAWSSRLRGLPTDAKLLGEPTDHFSDDTQGYLREDLALHEADLVRREDRLRLASKRLNMKKNRMEEKEQNYRERVQRLREREAKIRQLVERRRAQNPTSQVTDDEAQQD